MKCPIFFVTMASSPPRQMRRIGLSNPRAARGASTEAENRRVQVQNAADQGEAEARDHRLAESINSMLKESAL